MTAQPKQPDKSKAVACAFVIGAVIVATLALGLLWLAAGHKFVPGVTARVLGPCSVAWHAKRGALVLACPRQDMTRLWPLPKIHPWFEDDDPRERAA